MMKGVFMVKEKISVGLEAPLVDWLDAQVKKERFANRSHGIRYCVAQIYEEEKRSESSLLQIE